MNNEDMTRFYEVGADLGRPGDFVRRDKDGKVPGGLTLNKYTYTGSMTSTSARTRLYNIISNAKGNIMAIDSNEWGYSIASHPAQSIVQLNTSFATSDGGYIYTLEINSKGQLRANRGVRISTDGTVTLIDAPVKSIIIVYYNDVEITA